MKKTEEYYQKFSDDIGGKMEMSEKGYLTGNIYVFLISKTIPGLGEITFRLKVSRPYDAGEKHIQISAKLYLTDEKKEFFLKKRSLLKRFFSFLFREKLNPRRYEIVKGRPNDRILSKFIVLLNQEKAVRSRVKEVILSKNPDGNYRSLLEVNCFTDTLITDSELKQLFHFILDAMRE